MKSKRMHVQVVAAPVERREAVLRNQRRNDNDPAEDYDTHVSEIADASKNYGVETVGIAPQAKTLPVKVMDSWAVARSASAHFGDRIAVIAPGGGDPQYGQPPPRRIIGGALM